MKTKDKFVYEFQIHDGFGTHRSGELYTTKEKAEQAGKYFVEKVCKDDSSIYYTTRKVEVL